MKLTNLLKLFTDTKDLLTKRTAPKEFIAQYFIRTLMEMIALGLRDMQSSSYLTDTKTIL